MLKIWRWACMNLDIRIKFISFWINKLFSLILFWAYLQLWVLRYRRLLCHVFSRAFFCQNFSLLNAYNCALMLSMTCQCSWVFEVSRLLSCKYLHWSCNYLVVFIILSWNMNYCIVICWCFWNLGAKNIFIVALAVANSLVVGFVFLKIGSKYIVPRVSSVLNIGYRRYTTRQNYIPDTGYRVIYRIYY